MEDNLNGRRPQWKTSQWKTTLMEDDLNGRQPQWKKTSMEDELNGRRPKYILMSNMTRFECQI